MVAELFRGLSRFQPRHLRFELEAQLGAFVLRQPVRHLWENCAVKRDPCLIKCRGRVES
jgi:hypothetical protein